MNNKHKVFNQTAEPAIYIRMFAGVIMYIGETKDWRRGRPFRDSDDPKMVNAQFISKFIEKNPDKDWDPYKYSIGNWDQVRILPASNDPKRRRYWEAVLITKHLPITQTENIWKYYVVAKKSINAQVQRDNTQKRKEMTKNIIKNNNKKLQRFHKMQILDSMSSLVTLKKEKKAYEQQNN